MTKREEKSSPLNEPISALNIIKHYNGYNRFGKQTHERSSSKLSSSEIDHESLIRRYIYIPDYYFLRVHFERIGNAMRHSGKKRKKKRKELFELLE